GHLSARLLSIGEGKTGVAAVETDWTWRQRIGRSCEPAVGLAVRELGGLNQPQNYGDTQQDFFSRCHGTHMVHTGIRPRSVCRITNRAHCMNRASPAGQPFVASATKSCPERFMVRDASS